MASEFSGEGTTGNSSSVKMFLGGLLLGAVIGGTVALLYAPMKGEDTRKLLKEKAMMMKERADEVAAGVKEKASEIKRRGEEALKSV